MVERFGKIQSDIERIVEIVEQTKELEPETKAKIKEIADTLMEEL